MALAEMALAGGLGADASLEHVPRVEQANDRPRYSFPNRPLGSCGSPAAALRCSLRSTCGLGFGRLGAVWPHPEGADGRRRGSPYGGWMARSRDRSG